MEHGDGEYSVRPGLHQAEEGGHDVIWWDPAKLKLGGESDRGVNQIEILGEGPAAAESIEKYATWKAARQAVTEWGSRPSLSVLLAGHMTSAPPGPECSITVAVTDRAAGRPAGRRFGTLVHGVLRDAPLDADRKALTGIADVHGRVLGAPAVEVRAAEEAAARAWAHPLIARARAAERVHREYPLLVRLDEVRVVEGVLDLAFLENGEWHVVDFKTDADAEEARVRYEVQVAWYCFAMSQVTGLPARGWLLAI